MDNPKLLKMYIKLNQIKFIQISPDNTCFVTFDHLNFIRIYKLETL